MANLRKQDATVVIHGDSRYNNGQYDTVSVRSIVVTDAPLTQQYYVPGGPTISREGWAIIRKHGLEFRPYTEEELFDDVGDEVQEARENDPTSVEAGMARVLLRSTLVHKPLQMIKEVNGLYVYDLSYDYKIFPEDNNFQMEIRLPFSGISMPSGVVTLTVVLPQNVTVNQALTLGIDENGNLIDERVVDLPETARPIVTFRHQVDPIFRVIYSHNEGLFQG